MTPHPQFRWHPEARLFAADQQVARVRTGEIGFVSIPGAPVQEALEGLGAAVLDRRPFCLCDRPLSPDVTAGPGMFLTQSGGSSGTPKLIRRSQASWTASFDVNAAHFALTPADRLAVLGGLSHSLALYGVLEALHLGADAMVLAGLPPAHQHAALKSAQTTILYTTPTQIRVLAAQRATLPHLRLVLCGGGALDPATRQAAQALFPNAALHIFYGAAETSFITFAGPHTSQGSVGYPYPGVTLRILDRSHCPTTGPGMVWVQSPYLCDGYVDDIALPARDGFISAGEIGELDETGQLWLRGRQDRMVTIGDVNIFPETVEALINGLSEVGICAVLPRPDPRRGNHLVAILAATDTNIAGHVRDHCRVTLGAAMTPRQVLVHPDFPVLPSGKPDLRALKHWLEATL